MNKIEEQIVGAIQKHKEAGYNPKKMVVLTNPHTKLWKKFAGVEIEHRILRTPDGELIPIAFED